MMGNYTADTSPDGLLRAEKLRENDHVVALAGNPNVGKSTVFNALTGLRQHTGNWAGKTVQNAAGYCTFRGDGYVLMDLPGCYSLLAHSAEEAAARDFLCFGAPEAAVVVCDAICLERNLNLVLQVMELTPKTVVCVNLLDEARRRGIKVDLAELSLSLGVPVVGTSARSRFGLDKLMTAVKRTLESEAPEGNCVVYPEDVETAVAQLLPVAREYAPAHVAPRWLALRLIDGDASFRESVERYLGPEVFEAAAPILAELDCAALADEIVSAVVRHAEFTARSAVRDEGERYSRRDRKIDRVLTGRFTAFPFMFLLLLLVFWITMVGANYPSAWLSALFDAVGEGLRSCLAGAPEWLTSLLLDGIYKTLAWVVSVMLPPMAIFFPLFTLLEDLGYLPRVAFNLDRCFRRCAACGKQALTMMMGFGCNAAGVVGARIIDSPRERLIAILTNSFVPCNGRFPMLTALISLFFAGGAGLLGSVTSAALLLGAIVLGVLMTLLCSKLLSKTLLKGVPSSFTLELPPYRRPQVGKVILRAMLDRALFVLGRAALFAAPAGLLIWCMANLSVGDVSVLRRTADFLDPVGRFLGMDGVILLAFILGLPANEIVIPVIVMAYLATGSLTEMGDLTSLHALFTANGWTACTAACTVLFSLFHWPCATTLMTIRRETGSFRWTAVAALLPTAAGATLCALVCGISRIFRFL